MRKAGQTVMNGPDHAYHVHIDSEGRPFELHLREVWEYRDLIRLFTQRTFKLIYKQTVLGPLWLIIRPLVTSIIYTVVFGGIAGLSTAGVPRLLFYLSSHGMWSFMSGCLSTNASTFTGNASLFRKVYFPRLTIPISTLLSSLGQFLIQLLLVSVFLAYYALRGEVHPRWALLPGLIPLFLLTGLMGLGLGILISSVTTKYRDLAFLVGFGLQLWMYISPVLYPVSQLPLSGMFRLVLLNPMTAPMEIFRYILLGVGTIRAESVLSCLVFSFTAFFGGVLVFNRVERNFIDVI